MNVYSAATYLNEAATRIEALEAMLRECVEALEACTIPTAQGNIQQRQIEFLEWWTTTGKPTLTRAKEILK